MKLSNKVKELQSILDKIEIDDFYTFSVTLSYIRLQGWIKDDILKKYSEIFGGEFEEQIIEGGTYSSLEMEGISVVFSHR